MTKHDDESLPCTEPNRLAGRAISAPCVIMGCAIFTQPLDYIIKVKTLGKGFEVYVVHETGGMPETIHLTEESAADYITRMQELYTNRTFIVTPYKVAA